MRIPCEWDAILERMPELKEAFVRQQQEDADQLFPSFFLHFFRPDGTGLEEFLLPFPGGSALLERLLPLYRLTAVNTSHMYFVPPEAPPPGDNELRQLVGAFVEGQTQLIKGLVTDQEVKELTLNPTPAIVWMEQAEYQNRYTETLVVDEGIGDAFHDVISRMQKNSGNRLLWLYLEPLYMASCCYSLAQYLIWPLVQDETGMDGLDPLLPYYKFWRLGLRPVVAEENTVWIVRG